MVRVMGLEPTRPIEHKHLKLACLPIPAHSQMRERVGWVAESWDDIVEAVALDATPGIESRMRKSWKAKR